MIPGETRMSLGEEGLKDPHYSKFKVIQSLGSGSYYIGTMFLSCGVADCKECGEHNYEGLFPKSAGEVIDYGSRETDYFKTEKEAKDALEEYENSGRLPRMRVW